ncbi:lysophospholipid acyltransferase family protein [Arcicella rigui]|uniref:Lysophospholipid acyltransferase family protein n=1 Tax=Arcicella rigui TaxID=797020 RepID=A0ABU5QG72_9BACT|nr:lysophospholipid acyltransferase family protein [Arcicella rigui]MEA5141598.1 lysophospholipid acyltransferase family protein [Arcicella rigui]
MLFFKLLSLLPLWILYGISDFAYFILFRVLKYRKKVVIENLKNSFPEKTEIEIQQIAKAFYHNLADIFIEFFKGMSMSEREINKRIEIGNLEAITEYINQGTPVIIVGGHQGNWELVIHVLSLHGIKMDIVYQPLSNAFFEKLTYKIRTRFGAFVIPKNDSIKLTFERKNIPRALCLAADQIPHHWKSAYWTNFLNQDSAFFTGTEKIARKFHYPVVFLGLEKSHRGYYKYTFEKIAEAPYEHLASGEILERFIQRLEKSVQKNPSCYLWSHRRWKHKRSENDIIKTHL